METFLKKGGRRGFTTYAQQSKGGERRGYEIGRLGALRGNPGGGGSSRRAIKWGEQTYGVKGENSRE